MSPMSLPTIVIFLSSRTFGRRYSRLLYAQHIDSAGKQFFEEICRRDLEGMVGKRKSGLYREDRPDWLKMKNRSVELENQIRILTRFVNRNEEAPLDEMLKDNKSEMAKLAPHVQFTESQ
jgi:ATP-dependent DNA ligase